jgi:peptidoglycan-associated lipoprotein
MLNMSSRRYLLVAAVVVVTATACHKSSKVQPVVPTAEAAPPPAPPPPRPEPPPPPEPIPAPPEPPREDALSSSSLDDLNRNSPLRPAFFGLDSSEIDPTAKSVLDGDAAILRQNSSWVVTIEGHCDERGTAQYNLALGDRRANAAKEYLVSLGIDAGRIKTVSYGKERPFATTHDEDAWAKNRRAHFVVTAK